MCPREDYIPDDHYDGDYGRNYDTNDWNDWDDYDDDDWWYDDYDDDDYEDEV